MNLWYRAAWKKALILGALPLCTCFLLGQAFMCQEIFKSSEVWEYNSKTSALDSGQDWGFILRFLWVVFHLRDSSRKAVGTHQRLLWWTAAAHPGLQHSALCHLCTQPHSSHQASSLVLCVIVIWHSERSNSIWLVWIINVPPILPVTATLQGLPALPRSSATKGHPIMSSIKLRTTRLIPLRKRGYISQGGCACFNPRPWYIEAGRWVLSKLALAT